MHRPALSVVIPCYNEAACLELLHARVSASASGAVGEDHEIVLINDGSCGGRGARLSEAAGYVAIAKEPAGKRTRTLVTMTPAGRRAFHGHLGYLRWIIDAATGIP